MSSLFFLVPEALLRPLQPRAQPTVPRQPLNPTNGAGCWTRALWSSEAGARGRGLAWVRGLREDPPQLYMLRGSSKPFPPLTGCCRTTSWEESPRRRCGSCRAFSLCESLEGWAGEPASWGLTHSPGPPASASPPFCGPPFLAPCSREPAAPGFGFSGGFCCRQCVYVYTCVCIREGRP